MPVKPIIDSASLEVFPTGAVGTLRFFVDTEIAGVAGIVDPRVLGRAIGYVVGMGSVVDFGAVSGNPSMTNLFPQFITKNTPTRQNNQMRVSGIKAVPLNNSKKIMVEVTCKSRPQPTIEYDSSLTQRIVETYLVAGADGTLSERDQMTIGCQIPAGYYIPGIQPTENFNLPKTPLSAQVLRFGASFRITSTYYDDELGNAGGNVFGTVTDQVKSAADKVNSDVLLLPNDQAMWICSEVSITSPDGGYTNQIGASFVYNIDGWDTIGIYTDPFTGQKALLPQDVVDNLYQPLPTRGNLVEPYFAPANSPGPGYVGGGAAKFPQHARKAFNPIIIALLNNITDFTP